VTGTELYGMKKRKLVCESFEEEMVEKRAVKAEAKQLPRQRPCHVRRFAKANYSISTLPSSACITSADLVSFVTLVIRKVSLIL
jgi:hypothetical protein